MDCDHAENRSVVQSAAMIAKRTQPEQSAFPDRTTATQSARSPYGSEPCAHVPPLNVLRHSVLPPTTVWATPNGVNDCNGEPLTTIPSNRPSTRTAHPQLE